MSDLEKLFEHAPEGATEIAVFPDGELRYATEGKTWYAPRWIARPHKWQTIATRPQPEPRKTVEDVVAYYKNGNHIRNAAFSDFEIVVYEIYSKKYAFVSSNSHKGKGEIEGCQVVCTREQFEAFVAAKGNSEPEWTHVLNSGVRCKFFKSLEWMQGDVYESEDGKFFIPQRTGKSYSIKPIKPTISKDEKAQLELYVQYRIDKYGDHAMKSDLIDYLAKHEVVK